MFWESKKDQIRNEKFDQNLTRFVEDLGDVSRLRKVLYFTLIFHVISWLFVLLFSNIGVFLVDKFGGFTAKPVFFALSIPFFLGFASVYSIFRLKFPDMEENKHLNSDLMASLAYQNNSNKRWLLWLCAILAGLFNVALLIIVSLILANKGLYLSNFYV